MSRTIDERVVEMRFDNRDFERNCSTSMSTLAKLKQSLNLTGASKGLENVGAAAKNVNMSGLSSAVETVSAKFSALQVMGVTALANITNSAVNAGKRMVSALTIDPIKTGFSEYETQINAVQTILANTQSKGTTLQDVNNALDTLNTYADKTIYNFTEMTRNIGTFTAAGVDLDTSVSAIQGIANLAAVSGSSSQQASTAMYQLSQALANGKVNLMDWNSVVNAGMGGQVFQDALKRTATNMGKDVDGLIKKYGSFRESLTQGEWLTTDVLTKTLEQFTMAAEEGSEEWNNFKKSLMDDGYTEKQAEEILKMANTATDAATKVKTFTQLWDTLKESVQSGWTQTWEILIGDFGEAKEMLTQISETIGGMIGASAESRNAILSSGLSTGWKQLLGAGIDDEAGYIDTFKNVAKEHNVSIDDMIKAEKELDETLTDDEAFQKVLKKGLADGTLNADMLSESVSILADKMSNMSAEEREAAGYTAEHVKNIQELNEGLKNGTISMDEFVKKITRPSGRENIIESLWNAFNGLMSVIKPIKEAFSEIFPAITGEQLYGFTENLKEFTSNLKLSGDNAEKVKSVFKGVFSIASMIGKVFGVVAKTIGALITSDGFGSLVQLLLDAAAALGDFFTSVNEGFDTGGLSGGLSNLVELLSDLLESATGGIRNFGDALAAIGGTIAKVVGWLWDGLVKGFEWITENISAGDIFAGLTGGGIFILLKKLAGLFGKVQDVIDNLFGDKDGGGLKEKFGDMLDSVGDSLQAFTTGIKIGSLVAIAVAVGILSASLNTISKLKTPDIAKSLFAIGGLFTMLCISFSSISKTLSKFDTKGIVKSSFALILVSAAISILASAMVKLSDLSLPEIAKGLIAVGGGLAELSVGLKFIGQTKIPLSTSVAMLALAASCGILGDAMKKFSGMSWEEIGRGLTGMGGALGELVAAMAILGKFGGGGSLAGSVGIFVTVQSLGEMADSLKKFGEMKWDEIGRGLSAMGGALGEVAGITGILGKLTGFSGILGSGAILIVVQSLSDMADALKKFGGMTWDEICLGLSGMGGALFELSVFPGLLGKLTGMSGILGSGAILLVVQSLGDMADALKKFGGMTWDEICLGLSGMGGALFELAVFPGLLGKLTGMSGILGSGAILIAVQGLGDLADALKKFGEMSWDEIARGLVGMGGALLEVAGITGALGMIAGLPALLGSGAILITVQGLGDLADAMKKFGEMSWDEIGKGLAAMGAALLELAVGGALNSIAIIGSMSIATVAEPLGILADSVKKWQGVEVPGGLGLQLAGLAAGITSFTLGGLGALTIAALAEPLGTLASSVTKWHGVTVPEGIGEELAILADGIKAFTWGGLGASAIADLGAPLGDLADSVRKWQGVTVPENMGEQLAKLAEGVKSFSWAFMGSWSIDALAEPLGELPDAIKKWDGISIPDNLEEDLKSLASAVQEFTWAFVGGWSIDAVKGPLGDLAKSVKKWNDVTIPSDMGDKLKKLAGGVKAFSGITDISTGINGMKSIASSATKLSGVDYNSIAPGLESLASGLKTLGSVDTSGLADLKSVSSTINSVVTAIKRASSSFSKAGSDLMTALARGMKSGQVRNITAANAIIAALVKAFASKVGQFNKAGVHLMNVFVKGIASRKGAVKNAASGSVSSAVTSLRNKYSSFYNAGTYLVAGFAAGISDNTFRAEAKAKAMAKAAAKAAEEALDINSPSKVFRAIGKSVPEGFAQGIERFSGMVKGSTNSMADTAIGAVRSSITRLADAVNSDIDTQPTIRPVLDLSEVSAGASAINGMFITPSLGVLSNVGAISTMMNSRQNGNEDVIAAINKLNKALSNLPTGTVNNINGITYSNGNEISDAVGVLVRATMMEGRV